MGLWKRIEEKLWTGKVIREFGPVADGRYGSVRRTVSTMLTERSGGRRFIIRSAYKAFFSASVQFVELDRDAAVKLRAALDQALQEMA